MTRNTYYRYALIALGLIFLIAVGFIFLRSWEEDRDEFPEVTTEENTVVFQDVAYVPKDNVETFLIMGLDQSADSAVSESYNNNLNADFLMLFVLDHDAKQCAAIHINRDTMAEINVLGVSGSKIDTVTKQIALSHNYGNGGATSCHNTADAVSGLLNGVKVNHYMSLKMDAVAILNDLVGGVSVELLDDFTSVDATMIKGETVTLTGAQALHYVRTRYELDDSTNNTRMKRQKQYLGALFDAFRLHSQADSAFSADAVVKLSEHMVSDRSVTQLQSLAEKFKDYAFTGISDIAGESRVGEQFVEFYPSAASIDEIVIKMFYEPVK